MDDSQPMVYYLTPLSIFYCVMSIYLQIFQYSAKYSYISDQLVTNKGVKREFGLHSPTSPPPLCRQWWKIKIMGIASEEMPQI